MYICICALFVGLAVNPQEPCTQVHTHTHTYIFYKNRLSVVLAVCPEEKYTHT